jgi:hypothetical protein
VLVALLGVALCASSAVAGVCGDDVEGRRIACACGDVVVSDVRLRATDPVVSARCRHDGLIVRMPAMADSVTVDLAGQVLVGSGHGYGILVERGGSDGAAIIGGTAGRRGELLGFGTGIYSPNSKSVRRIERVTVTASAVDGIKLNTQGAVLVDVTTRRNGRTGLSMRGVGGRVVGLDSSENANAGARIASHGTIVAGTVSRNGRHGVVVGGADNDVSGLAALDNAGIGVAVHGGHHRLEGLRAEFNGKGDVRGIARVRR